ncbi:hypothetical protein CKO28_04835 [Rhodovibrio sodomensis]|uniref:YdbS-like PH domain-containing protein n=1 Tax=Rhodovibrio sodomensis TaxID=1088 RepID=A0ABS1DBS8_9PROT|nr:PH domain-containing protein [Rhodovibrio sodomensis]MBK1667354.1 hypothetical protein [Rhodovibrio sodomensis]
MDEVGNSQYYPDLGDDGRPEPVERLVWAGRPAVRSTLWAWLGAIAVAWLACKGLAWIERDVAILAYRGGVGGFEFGWPAWVPLAVVGGVLLLPAWRTLEILCTRYEVTTQRIFVHRGVLNRYHDQIEMHRVRDLDSRKPIWLRVLGGLGHLDVHSVDRTTPVLKLAAQPNCIDLQALLHELNKSEQRRFGYREFEGTGVL